MMLSSVFEMMASSAELMSADSRSGAISGLLRRATHSSFVSAPEGFTVVSEVMRELVGRSSKFDSIRGNELRSRIIQRPSEYFHGNVRRRTSPADRKSVV